MLGELFLWREKIVEGKSLLVVVAPTGRIGGGQGLARWGRLGIRGEHRWSTGRIRSPRYY